jgi:hypothetical protein
VTTTRILGIGTRDGKTRWNIALEGEAAGDPVVIGPRVAVPNTKSLLWVDPASGRVLRRFDPGTGVSAPATANGRRAYVLSNAGDLIALDLT